MKAQKIFERVTAEMANGKSYDEAWQTANAAPVGNKNASGPHKLTVVRLGTGGHTVHSAIMRFDSKEAAQEHRDNFFKDTHSSVIEPDTERRPK